MRYGLLVTDSGEGGFGAGKYVNNHVGCVSDNIDDAETYETVDEAAERIEELNATNAIRTKGGGWNMPIAPTYEIMAVQITLVEGWSKDDE